MFDYLKDLFNKRQKSIFDQTRSKKKIISGFGRSKYLKKLCKCNSIIKGRCLRCDKPIKGDK
jgi:hypothetical protein